MILYTPEFIAKILSVFYILIYVLNHTFYHLVYYLPEDGHQCSRNICEAYEINKNIVIPVRAWASCEVYRRLRLPDFKTIGT